MQRFRIAAAAACVAIATTRALAAEGEIVTLTARSQVESTEQSGKWRYAYRQLSWNPRATAIIICDMWDQHWCKGATRRVAEMAPRMDVVIAAAREKGILVIHAPSGTVAGYKGHPARLRAQKAPRAPNLPDGIADWCREIPAEKRGTWPIDQSDGGCDCEPRCAEGSPWRRQIGAIEIHPEDAISDSGVEIWNLCKERGIEHVILMGVHTNMCVIGRPFGLRNMARFGFKVALMRDMTDTMYNHRARPHVSHFTGTDLTVSHIEKFVCPTVTSAAFTGKPPFRFKDDARPRVVFIASEPEYGSAQTLPELAEFLALKGGLATEVLQGKTDGSGDDPDSIPSIESLDGADAAVLFVRRRALPAGQMRCFREYLERGKPLIALRTSSHAFAPRGDVPSGHENWPDFDREVLGCHYRGHFGGETIVSLLPQAAGHPIVKGITGPYQVRETLYRSQPLAGTCTPLLVGKRAAGQGEDTGYGKKEGAETPDEPVAWVNSYKGAKIFYTSIGSSRASFQKPWFRRMLVNAIFWGLDRPLPEGAEVDAGNARSL